MKGIIVLSLIYLSFAERELKIILSAPYLNEQRVAYDMICRGCEGEIQFQVQGSPDGSEVKKNQMIFPEDALDPFYVLTIRAIDSRGNKIEQKVTIVTSVKEDVEQRTILNTKQQIQKTISTESQFSNLLNSGSIESFPEFISQSHRYPEKEISTRGSLKTFSPSSVPMRTSFIILNRKSSIYSKSDEVFLRKISERHRNSIKTITNLLKVIDQANASKNQAEINVEIFADEYNGALQSRRQIQNTIIRTEGKFEQAKSAIKGLQNMKRKTEQNINKVIKEKKNMISCKEALLKNSGEKEKSKSILLNQLTQQNAELATNLEKLTIQQQQCQNIKNQREEIQIEKDFIRNELKGIASYKKAAQLKLLKQKKKVQQLQEELAQAQLQLSQIQFNFSQIKRKQSNLPKAMIDFQAKFDTINSNLGRCREEENLITKKIQSLKKQDTKELINEVKSIEINILQARNKTNKIDSQVAQKIKQLGSLKVNINKSSEDLEFLNSQVTKIQEHLRTLYKVRSQKNVAVFNAKQNIQAALNRYKKQLKIVSDATYSLQKARIQQNLVRKVMEQTIIKYSGSMPYVTVTYEKIHSPSQQMFESYGQFSYPQKSFIPNIEQNFDLETFYQFEVKKNKKLRHQNGRKYHCEDNQVEVVLGGIISEIKQNSFFLTQQNGQVCEIKLWQCTKLRANIPNYHFKIGNQAVIKGILTKQNNFRGTQVVCIN